MAPPPPPVKLIRDIRSLPETLRHGAVAIGNFDGVHRGHARIVERLRNMAQRICGAAVVFTFDPPPAALLRPEKAPPPLTTIERKVELLAELGVDAVIAYPTNLDLLQLSPQEFFAKIVQSDLAAQALVEGTNFFFGHDRAGTIEVLRGLTTEAGIQLHVVEPLLVDGEPVSSSRVRRLIAAGDVSAACRLLTQPYRICGTVVEGARRGAAIGFPTANLGGVATLLPGQGVYAGRAQIIEGEPGASAPGGVTESENRAWPAAINVGPNPTFGEDESKVEAHLIGCTEPLYGTLLAVDFVARLRDIHPFDNVEALKAQLARDIAEVKTTEWNQTEGR